MMRILLATLIIFAIAGCSDSNRAQVSGTVTLDGTALANATVRFTPIDRRGRSSYGRTDSDGRYQMYFSSDKSGVLVGDCKVHITTADIRLIDGREQMSAEMVPHQYNERSTLVRRVEHHANHFDFELSSGVSD